MRLLGESGDEPADWCLLLHGGAGSETPADREAAVAAGLRAALAAGSAILAAGGSALDAVEAAVRSLESSGEFNAGLGAVRDADGATTLDAAIMSGPDQAAGAVAAIGMRASAIAVARLVQARTSHVLLVGTGAERFADANGFPALTLGSVRPAVADPAHGTVGAVARDRAGRMAAATSTGGIAGKLPGRVGDSPLIGAGTWADGEVAVSATGSGEHFIRAGFAHGVALRGGGSAAGAACDAGLRDVAGLGGDGGAIVLARTGGFALRFSTAAMPRAFAGPGRTWVRT